MSCVLTLTPGYETVAGLGKTGYNIGSGVGGALSGKSGKQEAAKEEIGKEEAGNEDSRQTGNQ